MSQPPTKGAVPRQIKYMRPGDIVAADRARSAAHRSGRHLRAARPASAARLGHHDRRPPVVAIYRPNSTSARAHGRVRRQCPDGKGVSRQRVAAKENAPPAAERPARLPGRRPGVREFILLTAHEHDPHLEALSTVITSGARVRVVDIFGVDFSDLLEGQTEPMHGDEVDTSLLLYIAPELVDMSLAQDYMMSRDELRRYRRGWLKVPRSSAGSIGRPTPRDRGEGPGDLRTHLLPRSGTAYLRRPHPKAEPLPSFRVHYPMLSSRSLPFVQAGVRSACRRQLADGAGADHRRGDVHHHADGRPVRDRELPDSPRQRHVHGDRAAQRRHPTRQLRVDDGLPRHADGLSCRRA